MKQVILYLCILSLPLLLAACRAERGNDYLSVHPHVEQVIAQPEAAETEIPIAHNRTELRGALLSLIRNWQEAGTVLIRDYEGDLEGDLNEALEYATRKDPVGAYGVDYADGEILVEGQEISIRFSIVFRRSAAETSAIIPVTDNAEVLEKIEEALDNFSNSLTLRIRNYTKEDFSNYILDYCLENPRKILAIPEFSVDLYPEEGSQRILELHFSYPESKESMRSKLYSMQTLFQSSTSLAEQGQTEWERSENIFQYLTGRSTAYEITEETPVMPAYNLLCEKIADDLSLAIVFHDQCKESDLDSAIVMGEKNGETYFWNILYLDGQAYYVDLLRSLLLGESSLTLLSDRELLKEGYVWELARLPEAPVPEEEEPQRPQIPVEEETGSQDPQATFPPTENTDPTVEAEPQPTEQATESEEPTETEAQVSEETPVTETTSQP
ncbi:MAG: hypothetical protein IKT58_05500 [Oscillospiraceae bacterium]|nr:hypothetical protein [Oscillospiraceae bacterium]